jgi:hypothetical protein
MQKARVLSESGPQLPACQRLRYALPSAGFTEPSARCRLHFAARTRVSLPPACRSRLIGARAKVAHPNAAARYAVLQVSMALRVSMTESIVKCLYFLVNPLPMRSRTGCHRTVAFHGHASHMQPHLVPDAKPAHPPDLDAQLRYLEARLARVEAALLAVPSVLQPLSTAELAAIERAIAEHCH